MLPQVRGMSGGDTARKKNLVDYGFRLPSAYDNRPLYFSEFEERINQAILVSATPAAYERAHSEQVVEQIIRPTGLLDPEIEVRPIAGQVDDLMGEIRARAAKNERVLVTTLTKQMAEDLTAYLEENDVRVRRKPSLSASRMATSDTSGRSSPSRSRLMPTSTSNLPRRRSRMISMRSMVSTLKWI